MNDGQEIRGVRNRIKVKNDLNLYAMSKENLVKKVQILMHELMIYYRYEQSGEIMKQTNFQSLNKQIIEKDVIIEQLNKNIHILEHTLQLRQKTINDLSIELSNKQAFVENLKKQMQTLKKKMVLNQRNKEKENGQRIQVINRQAKQQMQKLDQENKRLRKIEKQLTNKVKILNDLNEQTQQKLANALLSSNKSITKEEKRSDNKQNIDTNKKQSNLKLQNLSLRQTIRTLRQQIQALQESKQQLKSKFHEKQLFYSRLVSLKHT